MGTSDLEVKIDSALIEGIISAKICTAISTELGNQDKIIEQIVGKVLSQKVNNEGKPSNGYSSDLPYIQWLCHKTIRDAAEKALQAWVEAQREKIEKEFLKTLKNQEKNFSKVFFDGLMESIKSQYRFTCNVNLHNLDY